MLYVATGNTDYLYHLNEENVSDVNIDAAYFLKALAAGQEASAPGRWMCFTMLKWLNDYYGEES